METLLIFHYLPSLYPSSFCNNGVVLILGVKLHETQHWSNFVNYMGILHTYLQMHVHTNSWPVAKIEMGLFSNVEKTDEALFSDSSQQILKQ